MIPILVAGMLISGATNSLVSKYQDNQPIGGGKHYEQPVLQTLNMFLGEMLCLVVYVILRSKFNPFKSSGQLVLIEQAKLAAELGTQDNLRDTNGDFDSVGIQSEPKLETANGWKKVALFWLPATFDIIGTSLMNVGLIFIPVSVYQMLRGFLVFFVALFSIIFLNRRLCKAEWLALLIVVCGVAIVGLSSISGKVPVGEVMEGGEAPGMEVLGIFLVLSAQLFTASQFVIEEKIMAQFSVEPLAGVGYEGFFGTFTTLLIMPIMYYFVGSTPEGKGGYFDTPTGLHQIFDNPTIYTSSLVIAISIAFFNFFGLAVTRSVSATARSTIDTCRTVLIWSVSLALGWESFKIIQVIGFVTLVYGTLIFNKVINFPRWTGIVPIGNQQSIALQQED